MKFCTHIEWTFTVLKNIYNFLSTDIEWIPINNIEISKEEKDDVVKFLEILEDDDDVQNIYTNLKF